MSVTIHVGDCRAVMARLEAGSVDAIVTDPPYELGFMGKGWDKSGVAYCPEVWTQALRLLKPGGHLLAFGGSRTYHRLAVAIEDAGFEVRDQIMWLYGSGFPKSRNGPWGGTALKPAHEPIVLARKPLSGTVAANVLAFGTGALAIDKCRVPAPNGLTSGGPCVGNSALHMNRDASKPEQRERSAESPLGRWPANVIHDGSEEVEAAFAAFGESGGGKRQIGGSPRKTISDGSWAYGGTADRSRAIMNYGDTGTPARFFMSCKTPQNSEHGGKGLNGSDRFRYCAKASKADRNDGLDGETNGHPTVKPTALMRYLCRLITPPGGTILDPFCGSGSTGRGAVLEGFNFVGVELSEEYADISRRRIAAAQPEEVSASEAAAPQMLLAL